MRIEAGDEQYQKYKGSKKAREKYVNFGVTLSIKDRELLSRLAQSEGRKPGSYIRLLIYRDAKRKKFIGGDNEH